MGYGYFHCIDMDWLTDKDYKEMLAEVQALRDEFGHYNGDKKGDDRHDCSAHAIHHLNQNCQIVEFITKQLKGVSTNV